MTTFKDAWNIWCRALGPKAYEHSSSKSDKVAIIRTIWVIINILTCFFIILGNVATHGWNLIGIS